MFKRLMTIAILLCSIFIANAHASICYKPSEQEMGMVLDDEAEMMQRQYDQCIAKQKALKQAADAWRIDTEKKFIPIFVNGIMIPIVEKETYALNNKVGKFTLRDDELHSVSVSSVYQGRVKSQVTFSKRPTLFVSISGFKRSDNSVDPWQTQLENRILENTLEYAQYRHMQVEWDSDENMYDQVRDLGDVVYDFLNDRKYKWDVVLVGFSRGGVFAHNLGNRIRESDKINNLVTVLLDPTAAPVFGDKYPTNGISVPHGQHRGYLYYDDAGFACGPDYPSVLCRSQLSTVSDKKISGYTNSGRYDFNTSLMDHDAVASKWVSNEGPGSLNFSTLWHDLNLMKPDGSFTQDGLSGLDVVKISRGNIQLNGNLSFDNDTVNLTAQLDLGKLGTTSLDMSAGKDGVEMSANVLVASAYAVASKDRIEASASVVVADLGVKLDKHGFQTKYDTLGVLSGEVQVDLGEVAISIEIFGKDLDLQFNTGKFVVSVGKEFVRTIKNVGGAIGDLFGGILSIF
ncbi:hypothetical protein [Pseudoalteromonas luteoviolacea]|uniref:DUF676 domain-containing protein n=1 Tax=Pseudoalteromonas luteoviolacea S4054 TaxID=1129367 RepID=A0A0F6A8C7_9GAMM|nr:hypothetical protein [Pseudoalteromonas luteoviolacea]AOT07652.1 hypothetical protein S4054249_07260 [Pseudoalteromonas luteoviolacea]AOT12568.1 hypothetical protein S40542_07260 [Pseudoalteromonas luteoviolacea]AOT17482.1 hypothetical protein S4054_07260 [Pseudoalteromonas luteoviolacea]KKE82420.1 hypothetical protein N479_18575 [Pseudoalteromonas luteoviolacea S4054]KZN66315.1 hypothetical protein N481_24275 [Pseudoalteromonas luteoviolacea S4047-1]